MRPFQSLPQSARLLYLFFGLCKVDERAPEHDAGGRDHDEGRDAQPDVDARVDVAVEEPVLVRRPEKQRECRDVDHLGVGKEEGGERGIDGERRGVSGRRRCPPPA